MFSMFSLLQLINGVLALVLLAFIFNISISSVYSTANTLIRQNVMVSGIASTFLILSILTYSVVFLNITMSGFLPLIGLYHNFAMRNVVLTSKWSIHREEEKMYTFTTMMVLSFVLLYQIV